MATTTIKKDTEWVSKSGDTMTGTLTISNSNSPGGSVRLWEDAEGGNIAIVSKNGYEYQIDSFIDSYIRLYAPDGNGGLKSCRFNRITGALSADGGFNGNATNVTGTVAVDHGGTGATTPAGACENIGAADKNFVPFYGVSIRKIDDALNVDLNNQFGDSNRAGYVYSSGTTGIPANCSRGIREVIYYNSYTVMVKIRGVNQNEHYCEWGNFYNGSTWTGWQELVLNADGHIELSQPLGISSGGTGSTTASGARSNLGIKHATYTQNFTASSSGAYTDVNFGKSVYVISASCVANRGYGIQFYSRVSTQNTWSFILNKTDAITNVSFDVVYIEV